jgi:dihydrofolate reductase
MARLIYSAIASLDGYVADRDGNFEWAAPDEEVHAFMNELERPIGTHLYGRRMYEVMKVWETWPTADDESAVTRDYADIWRSADKVVYSTTLAPEAVTTARTRLERELDPEAIRLMKSSLAGDIGVGGPDLAAQAFRARLVDECRLVLVPVIVGGGTRALPADTFVDLTLREVERFRSGFVSLGYEVGE